MSKRASLPNVVIYGIGSYRCWRVLTHEIIPRGDLTIENLIYEGGLILSANQSVQRVIAIDNTAQLRADYFKTTQSNLMEDWVCFIDTLEREGVVIACR